MGVVDLFTGDEIDLVGAGPSMLGFGCREVVDWLSGLLVLWCICVLGSRLISKLALSATASWSLLCRIPDAKSSAWWSWLIMSHFFSTSQSFMFCLMLGSWMPRRSYTVCFLDGHVLSMHHRALPACCQTRCSHLPLLAILCHEQSCVLQSRLRMKRALGWWTDVVCWWLLCTCVTKQKSVSSRIVSVYAHQHNQLPWRAFGLMVSALLTLADLCLCVLVGGMESAEALFFFFLYKRSNSPSMVVW